MSVIGHPLSLLCKSPLPSNQAPRAPPALLCWLRSENQLRAREEGTQMALVKLLDMNELQKLLRNVTAEELTKTQREVLAMLRCARKGKKPHRYDHPELKLIKGERP